MNNGLFMKLAARESGGSRSPGMAKARHPRARGQEGGVQLSTGGGRVYQGHRAAGGRPRGGGECAWQDAAQGTLALGSGAEGPRLGRGTSFARPGWLRSRLCPSPHFLCYNRMSTPTALGCAGAWCDPRLTGLTEVTSLPPARCPPSCCTEVREAVVGTTHLLMHSGSQAVCQGLKTRRGTCGHGCPLRASRP